MHYDEGDWERERQEVERYQDVRQARYLVVSWILGLLAVLVGAAALFLEMPT